MTNRKHTHGGSFIGILKNIISLVMIRSEMNNKSKNRDIAPIIFFSYIFYIYICIGNRREILMNSVSEMKIYKKKP